MHSAAQEMLRMGIWQRLLSQPLRYIYYLAGYVSPLRLHSASPPFRPAPKPLECDQCPLDVILNEQEPFHPSNVFFNSAIGHTRSFSTSVADRARRFPDRNKAREIPADRSSRASAQNKPSLGTLKRSRSEENLEKRRTSRRLLKKQALLGEKPDADTQTFSSKVLSATSSPAVSGSLWFNPQDAVVRTEPDTKYSSKSPHSFRDRFSLPEQAVDLRQKLTVPIGARAQRIKYRLWDTWIAREPVQGRLSSMQLFSVMNGAETDEHVEACGL